MQRSQIVTVAPQPMRMHRARESLPIRQESYRTAVFFIEFLRILWYNHGQRTDAARPSFFLSRPAGFFLQQKEDK